MAGISDDQAVDYYYQDDLYVERPDDKLSCPICLCPVQREAHLTGCCGRHFCRSCIGRLSRECKPCPMCKESPLAIFPNKERQREIKQIRVRCPLSLAQYRGVLNSGRGRQEGTVSSNSDSSGKAATLSEEKDFKATEKCCIGNQGGFSNTSDGSEVTILSENFDELKLSDNDLSTKCHKLNKVDENQATDGANKSEGSINRAKDSDAAATSACAWTGELGKVESHVSEVHGADALRQIKQDNDDVRVHVAQPGTCAVHGHQHHHHHHHNHSSIHILRPPRNVTYHGIRTQGGMTVHYHWSNPQPFNVSHSTASPSNNIVNDLGPSVPPSGAVHTRGSSEPTSEQGEAVGLSREPQPLSSQEERGFLGAARNVLNQDFNLHVSSTSRSTASDDQETTGGNGRSTGSVCRPLSNLEPDTHTSSTTGPQSHASEPPPPQAQLQVQPGSLSPREIERQVQVRAGQTPASVAGGQPSSPEQFMIVHSHAGSGLGQPIVQLVGPRRARGCPHHYHMRGMHGHHHHHHHHHRPPHFHHHHPPPPPHHGPPGPPHHPPHGHPPPGPGRGGHPHHHRHHHHHHRHHGCHGHHHHPPPH